MKFKKEQKPGEKPLSPLSCSNSIKLSPKSTSTDYRDVQSFPNFENSSGEEVCPSNEKLKNDYDKGLEELSYDARNKKPISDDSSGFFGSNMNYFNNFEGFYIQNDINLHSNTLKLAESNFEKT